MEIKQISHFQDQSDCKLFGLIPDNEEISITK